jgi:hypothetical protein
MDVRSKQPVKHNIAPVAVAFIDVGNGFRPLHVALEVELIRGCGGAHKIRLDSTGYEQSIGVTRQLLSQTQAATSTCHVVMTVMR